MLVSTVGMCLNTMPEFKIADENGKRSLENPIFALMEACCISWFTIEYLLRLAGKSNIKKLIIFKHVLIKARRTNGTS